jgi:VanZ family protein
MWNCDPRPIVIVQRSSTLRDLAVNVAGSLLAVVIVGLVVGARQR